MYQRFIQLLAYIQAWISWFTAITANNGVLPSVGKHALLQVLGEFILNNEHALNKSLSSCVGT